MANYIMNNDGTTYEEGKKKKKKNNIAAGHNYIMKNDGTTYDERPQIVKKGEKVFDSPIGPKINNELLNTLKKESSSKEKEFDKKNQLWKNKIIDNRNDKSRQMLSYNDKFNKKTDNTELITDNNKAISSAKKEYEEKEKARNNFALADYLYNSEKYSDRNYNPGAIQSVYDKTLGRAVRGAGEMLLNFGGRENEKYTDENGKTTYLPSALELKNQAVRKTYSDNIVGKTTSVLGDVLEGGGKIATATALDAITLGYGGTLAYNNDLAKSAYKDAINSGATNNQAVANAGINALSEIATGKLIGSATKGLTKLGGNTLADTASGSAFENLLEKGISKGIKNKTASKLLASGLSEATEEGLQEYLGALNDKLTLGKDIDLKGTTKNAGYSALVGGLTGGLVNLPIAVRNGKIQKVLDIEEKVNNKELTPQQGLVALEQVKNGTYEQNNMIEQIAQQKVQEVQQAVQQGIITPQEATQEINAITQTLNQQRNSIVDTLEQSRNNSNNNLDNLKINEKPSITEDSKNNIQVVPTKDIIEKYDGGGSRTNQYNNILKENIKREGIKTPIIVSSETGKILDGNHRLQIANELGIQNIPVKYVDSSNEIDFDNSDWYNHLKGEWDEKRKTTPSINERMQDERINNNRSDEIIKGSSSDGQGNQLYSGIQGDVNRSSIETVHGTDTTMGGELDNSSFSNEKQTGVVESKQKINTPKSYLTEEEQKELKQLKMIDEQGLLDGADLERLNKLEKKSNGIITKFDGLKVNNKYEDIKREYGKYKNKSISKENVELIDKAKDVITANKQGRRTVDEWKQVARFIGQNSKAKTNAELQELALTSWFNERPNQKENLNRQGKKYVKFGVDEWVNEIYKGAGVGEDSKLYSVDNLNDLKINEKQSITEDSNTFSLDENNLLKKQQNKIIQETNPMNNDYNTGIRNENDIRTWDEVLNLDDDAEGQFAWGDYTREDALKAQQEGKITVYSSEPIENGNFVSTSKIQATEYAGGDESKVYSKEVPLNEVAWINGDEGQYAKVETDTKVEKQTTTIKQQLEKYGTFEKQVDAVIQGKYPQKDALVVLESTPSIYKDIGLNDFPITMTQKHLYTITHATGKYKNVNYHNIDSEVIKQLPHALENPLNILKSSTRDDSIVVITELANKKGDIVVASIKVDGEGRINGISIDSNALTSTYGRNDYDSYMKREIAKGNMLYDIDEGIKKRISRDRIQFPMQGNSSANNISQSNNNVKSDISTNSNMQENKNNSNILNENKYDNVLKVKDVVSNFEDAKTGSTDYKKLRSWVDTSNNATNNQNTINQADIDKITYEVQSNKKTHEQASNNLNNLSYEQKVERAYQKLNSNKRITAVDITEAQLALREAATRGDVKAYLNLQQDIAIMGTELGQTVQAMSMIQKMSPDGQLAMLNKIVDRQQKLGNKNWNNIELDEDLVQDVLDSYDDDTHTTYNKEKMDQAVDKLKQNIADQIGTTRAEKVNEWRYLSMLGNPKTHIRNVVANVAMSGVKTIKDTFNATAQDLFIKDKSSKTTTLKSASKDVKQYAKELSDKIYKGEQTNKYNEKNDIESRKRVFKSGFLEALRKGNAKALDFEDRIFKEKNFKKSFAKYLTAQGIKTKEDIRTNPKIIEQAKIFAMEEAKIATFQQDSELANKINSFDNLGPVAKVARGAILPFTRTPLNIAKTGIEYTPGAGLLKTISDVKKVPSNQKAIVAIDGISKQITGTSLALLGYALAKSGIVTSDSGDDKEDKLKSDQGMKMDYSIKLGNTSYDMSWLSPSSMPFFVGATMYEQLEKIEGWDGNVVMEALAGTIDPLSEMSCVSSMTKTIKSYSKEDGDIISNIGKSTVQSYLSQFVPTVSSQFARLFDDTERSTYADKNSSFTFGEETAKQLMYKIPGVRNLLPEQTDYLGNSKKENENIAIRAFESFLSPSNTKTDTSNKITKKLLKLYDETGEDDILPGELNQYIKYKNENYNMTQKEYNQFKKDYGEYAYNEIQNAMDSDKYNNLSKDEQTEVISNIMKYSKYKAKQTYFDSKDIDYNNTNFSKANKAEDSGYAIADYYITKAKNYKQKSSKY